VFAGCTHNSTYEAVARVRKLSQVHGLTGEWLMLVTNLPGRNQTLRMRLWRALKACGAGSLRDGVYVMPHSDAARAAFDAQAAEIGSAGGSTHIFELQNTDAAHAAALSALFDRTAQYEELDNRLRACKKELGALNELEARRRLSSITRDLLTIEAIDFFPGPPREQLRAAAAAAERALNARFAPNEPTPAHRGIPRLDAKDYQRRTWVTRERLWIDRVCSAWLIQRFIDPRAKFVWYKKINDRPKRAIGFDFNGAEFTHVDSHVTFEVLLISFGLDTDPGLARLGALVHFLDVGGIPVPEAAGLSAIVLGAREVQPNDDGLLKSVTPTLDNLYQAFRSNSQ
jgi:hypothetical protein